MLDTLALVYRQRRIALRVFTGGALVLLLSMFVRGPGYQATATLMLTADRARLAVSPDADTRPVVNAVTDEDLNSETVLLEGEELRREVLGPLAEQGKRPARLGSHLVGLLTLPLRLPGIIYRTLHGVPSNAVESWVRETGEHLSVETVKKSNLIEVSFADDDPEWAARFVNDLVARHIARHATLGQQLQARAFFESQRTLLAERLAKAQAAQVDFYEREGWDTIPDRRARVHARLDDLEASLQTASTDLATANAQVAFLSKEIEKYPRTMKTAEHLAQNQAMQFMKPEILKLELERRDLLMRYAPESIRVRDVEERLAQARRLIEGERPTIGEVTTAVNPTYQRLEVSLATAKAQMAAASARTTALQTAIAAARAKLEHLDTVSVDEQRLAQDVSDAKKAYVTYTRKEEEARFSSALDESRFVNIAIAQPATVPLSPRNAHRSLTLVLGLVLSAAAGIGAAFVRDRMDPTVKSAIEARQLTGLPVLAEV